MYKNIKTFEDACQALGLDPTKVIPDFSEYPKEDQAGMIAHAKLVIVAKALNNGWKPNWNDLSQRKYTPWFDMQGGFSCISCVYFSSISSVGSRLCYENSELAEYAGNQFTDLYQDYFTI